MFWQCCQHRLDLNHRPYVMGILNVTPDSFSDAHPTLASALAHAERLVAEGADILDVGGESTRPGSEAVPEDEELQRVIPVIECLRKRFPDVLISIDTNKPLVASAALQHGASILNHVDACNGWPAMVPLLAQHRAGYVAMHMRGVPKTMQQEVHYSDVLEEVTAELGLMLRGLKAAHIHEDQLLFDPGIGFGKRLNHNLTLMANTSHIAKRLGRPLLMGISRKSWMEHLLEIPKSDQAARDALTASVSAWLNQPGVAVHRVHQVAWTKQALAVAAALQERRLAMEADQ